MVTYGNSNRFYKRKSNGKYLLDTYELYETFAQITIQEERIAEFIKNRQKIVSENTFWNDIGLLHSVLIHTVPVAVFNNQIEKFSSLALKKIFTEELQVPGFHSYSTRYCLEGFHLYVNRRFENAQDIIPYNLIFRNGIIETFTNEPFYTLDASKLELHSDKLLTIIKEQLVKTFKLFEKLSIDFPLYLSIRLNNTKNMGLVDTTHSRILGRRFEYDFLQLPIILISSDVEENKNKIKSIIDIIWQAVGINECSTIQFNKIFDSYY